MPSRSTSSIPSAPVAGRRALGVKARQALLLQAARPATLTARAATLLAQASAERRFAAGDVVLAQGTAASSAWLVVEGGVALGAGEGGNPAQQRVVSAGQWLDLPSAMLGVVHAEMAVATSSCHLLEIPLQSVMHADPGQLLRMLALATLLAAEVARLNEAVRGFATKDAIGRIATWLIEQARAAGTPAAFRMPQRKRDIAAQLGTSAETFSRALARLRTMGLIGVKGRSITLFDIAALERVAEPAASDG